MLQETLKWLCARLRVGSAHDGKYQPRDPLAALNSCYHDLVCLASQIECHAEKAPYPQVTDHLRQLAREKSESANTLKEKIGYLLKETEVPRPTIKSGKNHWERMGQDLEDQKTLDARFLQVADLLVEAKPDVSSLLRELVTAQAPHKERLLDLVARADPQAHQT